MCYKFFIATFYPQTINENWAFWVEVSECFLEIVLYASLKLQKSWLVGTKNHLKLSGIAVNSILFTAWSFIMASTSLLGTCGENYFSSNHHSGK